MFLSLCPHLQLHKVFETRYGKFNIYLSLKFYVKSILDNLELLYRSSAAFSFQFGYCQPSKCARIPKNQNSEPLNVF